VAEPALLDTSACFALLENEAGADVVEACLVEARAGNGVVHASFVTLTGVVYIITQERGAADAARALDLLKAWPVQWHHSDDTLCAEAAKLKARFRVSLADAFVAATALRVDAVLVHKDPEFAALSGELRQQVLPAKSAAR
jgi:predicted nucleic acid-binding protein